MYAAIRIRGEVDVKWEIRDTLELLRLHRANHLVLLPENGTAKGMIKKSNDYLTYGEISEAALAHVIGKRGRLVGDKRLDAAFYAKHKVKGAEEIAKLVLSGKKKLADFGIKPVFRLNPPSKGFERAGIKKGYTEGGVLGYRGKEINKLIEKMA